MDFDDLPKISLQKLKEKDSQELAKLKSCMIVLGFFKLIDHGLDQSLRQTLKSFEIASSEKANCNSSLKIF